MASLKLLLEFGGDPDLKGADGSSPLQFACGYGREEEAKLLLEYGADTNLISKDTSLLDSLSLRIRNTDASML
jgi:ankyrin repeat protein